MDVDLTPVSTSSIDTKEVVNKWLEKHKEGVLSESTFNDYWRTWVPKIYSPPINEPCLNWSFPEDEAARVLFQPLEMFICDDDPAALLQRLTQLDQPPAVCGRVFKMGEPTYSCRECGMDGTCVLCVDCFKQSEHRYHKYKMGTSGGGGCCDCGDKEAWKRAPFCDIHLKGLQQQSDTVKNELPQDFLDRCRIVFYAILWNAYDLLTQDQTMGYKVRDNELEDNDSYCTILYNDEIHTFEQVITTLTRTIKCDQRTSIEYVTNIDREGRAIVKCSNFIACNELKTEIQRFTSRPGNTPLSVLVVHSHIVAHQIYAMKLLVWLQNFLGHGEVFRRVFAEVALKGQQSSPSIIKGIMLRDSELWKSARTHWHRLLISGMLLEYENKKSLAKIFTKNYGNIMKDFIKDDHDHTYSISSLSVQLFTVPTLAYHLIEQDEVLFILLNTFHSECKRLVNKQGKLEFDRTTPSQQFQRAQFILYDLRYLLGSVPEVWTDDLRRNFLRGLSMLLNILSMMQGMDSVTRQVGQHMEFEPEWKSAFNLHIKLSCAISMALKWCGTDKVVLVKAYRATLSHLNQQPTHDPAEGLEFHELADHSVGCLPYDVSTKPVSIHVPLTRFLAGLHLCLEQYGLNYDSPELQVLPIASKSTQDASVTPPRPTPVQIIEPILRTQVMISQVHAGMWRRNGYALLNQLYFYRDVKCRTEMLDRDVTLLQVGSALIESNEFLIHLLYKFQLLNWTQPQFELNALRGEEDNMRQLINLVEEFLQLLVMIVGERYVPGISNITTEDRVKKEIIQHLCIKPLPHSELNRCIPDDITYETGVDDVIDELATFKKPSSNGGKGVYELKAQHYEEYNVFYYHYTREELSKSEENMRQKRKAAGQLECCPPPMLPKLNEAFNMVVNLLQCDVMLHIMKMVLERSVNLRARSFSELQLHKVLHLIGYGLQEEQTEFYPFLLFSERARKVGIPGLLEQLLCSARIESHKDLIRWVLNKFKEVSKTVEQTTSQQFPPMDLIKEETKAVVDDEREKRAKLAAIRRAKIMAQMTAAQNSFMKQNKELFEETQTELSRAGAATISNKSSLMIIDEPSTSEMKPILSLNYKTVCLGPQQSVRVTVEKSYTCILCQEEQTVAATGPCLVMAAFVQQATVLCQYKRGPDSLMDVSLHDPLFLNSNLGPAPHIGTCGHVMHSTCWQKYVENVMTRERKRPYRVRHSASFDVDRQEFLCPLCECLSNTVLPVMPALATLQTPKGISATFVKKDEEKCKLAQLKNKKKKKLLNYDVNEDVDMEVVDDAALVEKQVEEVEKEGTIQFEEFLNVMKVILTKKKRWSHGIFSNSSNCQPPTDLSTQPNNKPQTTSSPTNEENEASAAAAAAADAAIPPPPDLNLEMLWLDTDFIDLIADDHDYDQHSPLDGTGADNNNDVADHDDDDDDDDDNNAVQRQFRNQLHDARRAVTERTERVRRRMEEARQERGDEEFAWHHLTRHLAHNIDGRPTGTTTTSAVITSAMAAAVSSAVAAVQSAVASTTAATNSQPQSEHSKLKLNRQKLAKSRPSTQLTQGGSASRSSTSSASSVDETQIDESSQSQPEQHSAAMAIEECGAGPGEKCTSKYCGLEEHQVYYMQRCPDVEETEDSSEAGKNTIRHKFLGMFSHRTPKFGPELKSMIQVFAQVTYTRGLNVDPNPTDRRLAPMAWKSCAYTVHAIETVLRAEEVVRPLLGHLSSRHRDCLENMVRTVALLGSTWKHSVVIIGHSLRLLGMVMENNSEGPSFLDWDSFGMLCALTFSLPSLMNRSMPASVPMGGVLELHTLRLIFISHIVKILLTTDYDALAAATTTTDTAAEEDIDMEESDNGLDKLMGYMGLSFPKVGRKVVWGHVQEACKPFLRCCVLFYHYLTDVPASIELTQIGGDTFENMCTYLGLPDNCVQIINDGGAVLESLIKTWISHETCTTTPLAKCIPREPLPVNRLVNLPSDYSELINTVSAFTCPNSEHEDSRNPTMCLMCSEVLCSQSYCCQQDVNNTIVGACNAHAMKCGAGIGVFLRVRECEILYLASPYRGCFVQPPYLDAYGETDQGLRRGNPLRLCTARYQRLRSKWLAHGIHEEIARTIETSSSMLPTQWQHL